MGKKLYVGNLPFSATTDSLKETFSQFGEVESVNIIMDNGHGPEQGVRIRGAGDPAGNDRRDRQDER